TSVSLFARGNGNETGWQACSRLGGPIPSRRLRSGGNGTCVKDVNKDRAWGRIFIAKSATRGSSPSPRLNVPSYVHFSAWRTRIECLIFMKGGGKRAGRKTQKTPGCQSWLGFAIGASKCRWRIKRDVKEPCAISWLNCDTQPASCRLAET